MEQGLERSRLIAAGREAETALACLRPMLKRKREQTLERLSKPSNMELERRLVAELQAYQAIEDEFVRDVQAGRIAERQQVEEGE